MGTPDASRDGRGTPPTPLHDDAFIGREAELARLNGLVAQDGPFRHAFLEGAAGMGKTRLVAEFLAGLDSSAVTILRGYCYEDGDLGPYAPFRQVLSGAKSRGGSMLDRVTRAASRDPFEPGLDRSVERSRGELIDGLAAEVLEPLADRRAVLCVEDIQWADVGSLLLLNRIFDAAPAGLRIICTYRSEDGVEPDVGNLIFRLMQRSTRIVLQGLSREHVRDLVAHARYASVHLTDRELDQLTTFTRGNPMFVAQMLLQLEESGALERQTLREALDTANLPEHLAGFVQLRLRHLDADELDALCAAAAIGQACSAELVARAIGASIEQAEERLEAAVRRRVLQRAGTRETLRYEFSHPIFVKQLYDMTPPARRRMFHTHVAAAASLTVEEGARHLALGPGSEHPESASLCVTAAKNAEQVFAFDRATRFWDLARLCARDEETRAELLRRLGWSLWYSGKWERARDVWQEAIALFRERKNDDRVGELALALGDMHRWRQEHEEAERWLTLARELSHANKARRAHALALLGSLRCLQGKEDGVALLEDAGATRTGSGIDPLVAYWVSYGFLVSGDRVRSYWTARSGLREARNRGDDRATALLAASLFHRDLGRLRPRRAAFFNRLLQSVSDRGDPTAMIRAMLCEALLLGYRGSWGEAARTCDEWLSTIRLAGRFQVATASFVWGEAQAALGNAAVAEAVMRRVLPDLEQARGVAAIHLARVLACNGKPDEARSLLDEHAPALAESPRFSDAAGRVLIGEVASHLEDAKLWERSYTHLLGERYALVMTYSPVSPGRVVGRLAGRLLRWSDAFEYFDSTAEELRRGGAHGELLRTLLDHAEFRRRRGRRGDDRKADSLELEAGFLADELGLANSKTVLTRQHQGNRFDLTARELEVLEKVAAGLRNQEIADALSITQGTTSRHLENIFMKIGARTRTEAVMLAIQERLITPAHGPRR